MKYYLGMGTGEEDQKEKLEVIDRPDPEEYVLVKNPRYSLHGGGPSDSGGGQPEFIWVKRKDAPFTADAFVRGRKTMEASSEQEARFAATRPPEAARAPRPDERFFVPPEQLRVQPRGTSPEPARTTARRPDPGALLRPVYGYVLLVKGKQVYTDLTEGDGVRSGQTVIIYREGEELKHPVTGAVLGRAEDEVGRARLVEVGEKTSLAEVVSVREGEEVRPKDKVKLLRAD